MSCQVVRHTPSAGAEALRCLLPFRSAIRLSFVLQGLTKRCIGPGKSGQRRFSESAGDIGASNLKGSCKVTVLSTLASDL